MEPSCVRQTLIPSTSKLFGDYLYHFERLRSFYFHDFSDPAGFREAAEEIHFPEQRRTALVSALREQNGNSAALDRLAQPGTVAVVTGQQVGLLSGPAYTVFKAITAVKLAQQLNERGVSAVPVFWLATEDHDLAEVDHSWVFDHNATPHKIMLSATCGSGGPVGRVSFEDDLATPLRRALGGLPFAAEVIQSLNSAYQPGATLGGAFRAFLQNVLQDFGLLFVDPLQPAIREISAPFLLDAARAVPELIPALRKRNEELVQAGYHTQVHIENDTSLLFLINGKRSALRWQDGRFVGRDSDYSTADLSEQAQWLSANALLRPVMQDYLFPTISYVAGPAEIAYFAQAEVLYRKLLGRMPVIFPRNSSTLLDARAAKILGKYGLRFTDLLDTHQQVRSRMAAKLVPAELAGDFEAVERTLDSSLTRLQDRLCDFDSTLEAAAKKSTAKILYQVKKLARKTANETLRRDERASRDSDYLLNLIYPERHLQERFYSIVPFLAKAGLDLPNRLLELTQLGCPDHVVRTI
jgi:bacillithiol synthase